MFENAGKFPARVFRHGADGFAANTDVEAGKL
jgi:hypothetical protein